ncbi:hypothetical protein D3C86_1817160 [compost metagenome]
MAGHNLFLYRLSEQSFLFADIAVAVEARFKRQRQCANADIVAQQPIHIEPGRIELNIRQIDNQRLILLRQGNPSQDRERGTLREVAEIYPPRVRQPSR